MQTKIVDITNGYVPGDPNSVGENLEFTRAEDDPHPSIPLIPYEGWNFLPTSYGYRSFFGTNATLDVGLLASRCQEILLIQGASLANKQVALCEDGIWTVNPATSGAPWVQEVVLAFDPAVYRAWTWVTINNKSYFYQQGRSVVWRLSETLVLDFITPSFITMAGQEGIFQAGGRLGMWDSLNSVSWSSIYDYSDFTPSLETMAGSTQFLAVVGDIITIHKHGDGFVIYATKSIITVHLSLTSTGILWDATPITMTQGIRHAGEVAVGSTAAEHYLYTQVGIIIIKTWNSFTRLHDLSGELTQVTDFLKEDKDAVFIKFLGGRFLFVNLINPNYINGIGSSYETTAATVGAVQVYFKDDSQCLFRDESAVFFTGSVTLPSASFNIPVGENAPSYPAFQGALVYDTVYTKWGKYKGVFNTVLELTPSNAFGVATSGFTDFGMDVGVLNTSGIIKLFDSKPVDSYIRYGKIGYSRQGYTQLLEAKIYFRSNSTGTLEVESSLNGRDLNASLLRSTDFTDTREVVHNSSYSARWHTLGLRGQWDLQFAKIGARMASIR